MRRNDLLKCAVNPLLLLNIFLLTSTLYMYKNNQYLQRELAKCRHIMIGCGLCRHSLQKCERYESIARVMLPLIPFLPKEQANVLRRYKLSLYPLIGNESVNATSEKTRYSCPEVYKGPLLFAYPYTRGFIRENCSKPSIYSSTSVILMFPVTKDTRFIAVIKNALQLFHQVIIITSKLELLSMERLDIIPNNRMQIVEVDGDLSYGGALNRAISLLKSPFILIASRLGRLDREHDIERLIHVQELSKAAIVGSAVKFIDTGIWDQGCFQTQLKLYTVKYVAGYYTSRYECLFCDYLVSPFIARRELLMKHQFHDLNHGVFRDFFMRLKMEGEIVLSCPDVMFYVERINQKDSDLVEYANVWDIRRIIESDRSVRWFGFKRDVKHGKNINFHLIANLGRSECGFSPSISVPPDCRSNLVDAIVFVLDQCKKYNIVCELEEGTLLGAVKFNHALPWERDADITFLSKDFHKLRMLKDIFSQSGFKMSILSDTSCCKDVDVFGGVIYIYAYGWTIEMYGERKVRTHTEALTLINFANKWVNAPENPGLYIRNRYGVGVYKHAEHWRTTKKDHGYIAYDSGVFPKCIIPGYHSCLNQFPADGNIPFIEWL